jgi:hypothetical protein
VAVIAPVVAFIVIVGYEPTLPPLMAICNIEYDRPVVIKADAVEVPADAVAENKRTIAGDVGTPLTTVRVYGV